MVIKTLSLRGAPVTYDTIHVLLPADRLEVGRIVNDWGHFSPAAIREALEFCDEAACHPFQEYYGYCAKRSATVSGFIIFGLAPLADRCWDLYWIGVAPRFTRQGVGRTLLGYMETVVIGQHGRQIHVETSSRPAFAPARALYETMGFFRKACMADYFCPGDDKLIYVKTISA